MWLVAPTFFRSGYLLSEYAKKNIVTDFVRNVLLNFLSSFTSIVVGAIRFLIFVFYNGIRFFYSSGGEWLTLFIALWQNIEDSLRANTINTTWSRLALGLSRGNSESSYPLLHSAGILNRNDFSCWKKIFWGSSCFNLYSRSKCNLHWILQIGESNVVH